MRLSSLPRKFGGNPSAASAFFSHSYALLPIGYPMGRFGPVRCIPLADGATLTTLYLQFVAGDGNLVRLAGSRALAWFRTEPEPVSEAVIRNDRVRPRQPSGPRILCRYSLFLMVTPGPV